MFDSEIKTSTGSASTPFEVYYYALVQIRFVWTLFRSFYKAIANCCKVGSLWYTKLRTVVKLNMIHACMAVNIIGQNVHVEIYSKVKPKIYTKQYREQNFHRDHLWMLMS